MKSNSIEAAKSYKDNKIEIRIKVDDNFQNMKKITDAINIIENEKDLKIDIKQWRNKRSLDANAYCFVLCDKIAKVIGNTKEYVYKAAIKQVGEFEILPIKDEAVEKWIRNWEQNGLGWQSEKMEDSKLEGYTKTINYYGSSTYDTKMMAKLLEEIIYQAKELDIDTVTPDEKEKLISKWENKGRV